MCTDTVPCKGIHTLWTFGRLIVFVLLRDMTDKKLGWCLYLCTALLSKLQLCINVRYKWTWTFLVFIGINCEVEEKCVLFHHIHPPPPKRMRKTLKGKCFCKGVHEKRLTYISLTASPTPQNLASSSMPSSLMTVLSTSKQTASALLNSSFVSWIVVIVLSMGRDKIHYQMSSSAIKSLIIQTEYVRWHEELTVGSHLGGLLLCCWLKRTCLI